MRIGATATNAPAPAELARQAEAVEAAIMDGLAVIGGHALWWESLKASAAELNVKPEQLLPAPIIAENEAVAALAYKLRDLVGALNNGSASLQPWKGKAPGPIRWAIVKAGTRQTELSAWPIVPIVWFLSVALATSAIVYVTDAINSVQATKARALLVNANTLAALQKSPAMQTPAGQAQIADAIARANQAASSGIGSWISQAAAAAATVAGTGIGIGALFLLFMFAQSRRKGRR